MGEELDMTLEREKPKDKKPGFSTRDEMVRQM
jgi:hypothetical protein